ncbi:hypothetical protein [Rhizobium leguminosarum]|jgi:hypothetical protein|uniref:hypothetical protein n=1 Tax=Rhizobium leguminosarum TaxID=384 RepID=UPI003F99BB92
MNQQPPPPKEIFSMPNNLEIDDQVIYAIGALVVMWATAESLFWGLFNTFTAKEGTETSAVLWLSVKNTSSRIELIRNVARQHVSDDLCKRINECARDFESVSRLRNIFCHAYYRGDPVSQRLATVMSSATSAKNGIVHETMTADADLVARIVKGIETILPLKQRIAEVLDDVRASLSLPPLKWNE